MGKMCRFAVLLVTTACLAAPAFAIVTVSYGDPDRFTDAADRSNDPRDIAASLATLAFATWRLATNCASGFSTSISPAVLV